MGFKNKAFALVAALALTFTTVGGAMAVPGDVDLAPGDCVLVLGDADFNFGTWKWNGPANQYDLTELGTNVSQIAFSVYYPTPAGGYCFFSVTTAGLYLDGNTSTSPITNFSHNPITIWSPVAIGNAVAVNGGGPSGWDNWRVILNSVPNTYVPGNYSGTFEFQVSSVAP